MAADPVGLQVASFRNTAQSVLVAYEVTAEVVDEAERLGTDVILAFHPLIYDKLAALPINSRVPYLLHRLIKLDIALVIAHTNFDMHPRGTSHLLAAQLGFTSVGPLVPWDVPGFGMGIVAKTEATMNFEQLLENVCTVCRCTARYVAPPNQAISTVAIVGGSGMSFLPNAIRAKASVFITADVKYHGFHEAKGVIGLIDVGHAEMEQFVPSGMAALLQEHSTDFTITVSSVNTNPVRYYHPRNQEYSETHTGSV